MRLVQDLLADSAERSPDKIALVCGEQRLDYAEVAQRARRLANALRDRGCRRGDRVVLWLPNGADLAVAIFGVLQAGCVFVPLAPTAKGHQVAFVARDCEATVLVLPAARSQLVSDIRKQAPSLRVAFGSAKGQEGLPEQAADELVDLGEVWRSGDDSSPPARGVDRDLACLVYTSGSTGRPRGVVCGHDNVLFAARSITAYLRNTADDVVISALPMSFDYGLYQWLMVCLVGGTLVLEPSFTYPAAFLQRLASERATGLPGVPTMFAMLLELDLDAFDLSSLRYVTNTGAALPARNVQRLRSVLPGVDVYAMYGMTETKRGLYLPPELAATKAGSVGFAIPGTEVWLEDESGCRIGAGEVGELVIRGGHVMRGYWQNPEATERRFRPGPTPGEVVCHTGDLFRRDEDGCYWFVSRTDDILKSRGEKVSPVEVEEVISELEAVIEVCVVGEDDPLLGQSVIARVVRREGALEERSVLRHCRDRLEDYKIPRRVEFVPELPKTSTGKVKR